MVTFSVPDEFIKMLEETETRVSFKYAVKILKWIREP